MKNWEDLQRRLLASDGDAWADLYSRLQALRGRRYNLHRDKDLLHDLVLRLFTSFTHKQGGRPLERLTNLRGYCVRAASNLLADRNDPGQHFLDSVVSLDSDDLPADPSQASPVEAATRSEESRIVDLALGRLRDSDRQLLLARYREGLRLKALASRNDPGCLPAAEDTLRVRVRRARDRLRRILLTLGVRLPSNPAPVLGRKKTQRVV